MNRSLTFAGPLLILALVGCNRTDADPSLRRFESCDELEAYMKKMAEAEVKDTWSRGGWGSGTLKGGSNDMALAETTTTDGGSNGAATHTGTNLDCTNKRADT